VSTDPPFIFFFGEDGHRIFPTYIFMSGGAHFSFIFYGAGVATGSSLQILGSGGRRRIFPIFYGGGIHRIFLIFLRGEVANDPSFIYMGRGLPQNFSNLRAGSDQWILPLFYMGMGVHRIFPLFLLG
jgi:hypothetical protein